MRRVALLVALAALLFLARATLAADTPPPLAAAHGKVEKVEKDSLTVQPRGADGKFGKGVVLKLTGTSKISLLTTRMQGGKLVIVQRDAEARDLKPGQAVAVIYTTLADGNVLLAAVAQPAE